MNEASTHTRGDIFDHVAPGKWYAPDDPERVHWIMAKQGRDSTLVAEICACPDDCPQAFEADQRLICDAGTTFNCTGKTPSELAAEVEKLTKQRDGLLHACRRVSLAYAGDGSIYRAAEGCRDAIAECEKLGRTVIGKVHPDDAELRGGNA